MGGKFGDVFDDLFGPGWDRSKRASSSTPPKPPAKSDEVKAAESRGVQAGSRIAVKAAAAKARALGFETLARDIETIQVGRK